MLDKSSSNFKFYKQLYILYFIEFIVITFLNFYVIKNIDSSQKSQDCVKSICNEYYNINGFNKYIDLITIIIPPIIPIVSTFSFFISHYVLNKNKISCFSQSRLFASSVCNKFIFDKTGTLTEDEIELSGFLPIQLKNFDSNQEFCDLVFYEEEVGINDLNFLHKNFWKKFCKNSSEYESTKDSEYRQEILENPNNYFIFLTECLATCHTIDKIKNIYYGNSLDKKIFENMKWILISKKKIVNINNSSVYVSNKSKFALENNINDNNNNDDLILEDNLKNIQENVIDENDIIINNNENQYFDCKFSNDNNINNLNLRRRNNLIRINNKIQDQILYDIIPKHSHKITENLNINDTKNIFYGKTYKLGILKRFEFLSTFQSLSVIVRNNFDESIRYYIKGAPEKIISICNHKTVPLDYHEKLMSLTKVNFLSIIF